MSMTSSLNILYYEYIVDVVVPLAYAYMYMYIYDDCEGISGLTCLNFELYGVINTALEYKYILGVKSDPRDSA